MACLNSSASFFKLPDLWLHFCSIPRMMKRVLFGIIFLISFSVQAQNLNWFISAHAGANNFETESVNGALLAGFENTFGHQVAFGPVFKSFTADQSLSAMLGARVYSQMRINDRLNAYLQADLSNGDKFSMIRMNAPLRLETGMGLNVMLKDNFGVGCGYTFGEYNPFTNQRRSAPTLKLVYSLSFANNNNW